MSGAHSGLRDGTIREVSIEYGTTCWDMQFVDRMFDASGSETTDPVVAIEVEIDGNLVPVVVGGVFDIKVRVESK
jgi:hypothetical protein